MSNSHIENIIVEEDDFFEDFMVDDWKRDAIDENVDYIKWDNEWENEENDGLLNKISQEIIKFNKNNDK